MINTVKRLGKVHEESPESLFIVHIHFASVFTVHTYNRVLFLVKLQIQASSRDFSCDSSRNFQSSRSSHQKCSIKKGVVKTFAKFTGQHLCQSLLFNKVTGLSPATLLKKRLSYRCFPVSFAKFLGTPILKNICKWLLLEQLFYIQYQRWAAASE